MNSFFKVNKFLNVRVIIRYEAEKRITEKRFKGADKPIAGNFSRWSSIKELMEDPRISSKLLTEFHEACKDEVFGTVSFEVDFGDVVGWTNTDDVSKYDIDALERFEPNRRSTAMRVKLDRVDLKAPKTNFVTFVCEMRDEPDVPTFVIHSIYPGNDIGEVSGDMTEEEKIVFFDWNHPGVE